ncbi:MAG: septal ring lytic transglycosylase RlpA family protein [Bacteroidota bacterium]|nr:septal ring lytic transglycosylase RlpA family protein [Bacteroidota bacterium]
MKLTTSSGGILVLAFIIGGCVSSPRFTEKGRRVSSEGGEAPAVSHAKSLLTLTGIASYYADDFNGKKTANGETYDMNGFTAAHRSLPFGTKVRVTNLENGRQVVVRINDRGPFQLSRIIDLSLGAAKALGMVANGTAKVKLEVIGWGDNQYTQ